MPYLGNIPATQFAELKYQDFTGGTGTSFTLNDPVGSAQELEVFVNNVRQEPGVAYTVSGTALTMTGSIVATDDFYVVFQGKSTGTATHPAGQALTATDGTFTGDLTVDTSTLVVDAANNRVGIGDTTPDDTLSVYGGTQRLRVGNSDSNHVRIGRNSTSGNFEMMRTTSGATDQVFFKAAEANNGSITLQEGGGSVILGGDIRIGGTGTSNALSDYEQGTWTPVLGRSSSNPSFTYTEQLGAYIKIGNMVWATFDITANSGSGGSGDAQIQGLPFTVTNDNADMAGYSRAAFRSASIVPSGSAGNTLNGFAQRNATYVSLERQNSGTSGYATAGNFNGWNASGRITGYIIYSV